MRLKKIELFGFKSFADRTELIFNEGVTCIVGPNGCGKSNISDAIRWVLGERSAKLLRGSKMEDVIFNGTDFRKPLALAEVSLTLDNTTRGLPIDYSEVTLSRRLYRSGESEYLINKTPCRLKDIEDLILDTGVGSNSYSMIEQGRIDYILNAGAEERRFLIEEAAGISKYKVKKEEAIRKLERTEENRLRLLDILEEVHKNIQYAERQARRAARYRDELERLKKLEITKAFHELDQLKIEQDALQLGHSCQKAEMEDLESQIHKSRGEEASLGASLQELLNRFREAELSKYALRSKLQQGEQRLGFHQEQLIEIATRRGQIEQEVGSLTEQRTHREEDMRAKQKEGDLLRREKEAALRFSRAAEESLEKIHAEVQAAKREGDRIRLESFESASLASKLRNETHRLLAFLESGKEQRRRQEAVSARLQQESSENLKKKEACEGQVLSLQQKMEGRQVQKKESDRQCEALAQQMEIEGEKTRALELELHDKRSRVAALLELRETCLADEKILLEDFEVFEKKLASTLREVFTVRPGFEWALDAALESFARSLIVEDLDSAEKLLVRLREKKSFPVGLFIRNLAQGGPETPPSHGRPSHPGILFALEEVIRVREGYEEIFKPFLHSTYIVASLAPSETLKEYLPLAWENRLLTQEGILLGPRGRIFYCDGRLGTRNGGFSQQAEIEQGSQEIASLEEKLHFSRQEIICLQRNHESLLSEGRRIESEITDSALRKESLESFKKGWEERLQSLDKELALARLEGEERDRQEREFESQKEALETELAAAEAREKALRQELEAWVRKLEGLDLRKNEELKNFAREKTRLEHFEERLRLSTESLQWVQDLESRNHRQGELLHEETVRLRDKEEGLRREDAELSQTRLRDQEALQKCAVDLELVQQDKLRAETKLALLQTHLHELLEQHAKLKDEWHQFEMKGMDLSYQEKNLHERLEQTYRVRMADFAAEDFPRGDQTPEEIEQAIVQLKERVESLGTVNLLAIEEYEELKKRYDFLLAQQNDLEGARESLLETIRKINHTTKGLFEETFAHVQKTFQEYYQTLFRGGQAKLILIDETHPLESGIDIMVRPPGKKLQHISLLSGGEKALTAIALLFALFKIKPSPFCVLDEVDAPLDEANIDRFLTVLQTFLASSQFIIVTHNRKTIAMGDSLYGVTMEEPGISKMVSVKVRANEAQASALEEVSA